MDHPLTPPTGEPGIQQCLAQFSADLAAKYGDDQLIPSRESGVHRYLATRLGGCACVICVRTHPEPLSQWELDQQRVLVESIRQTRHPYLCPIMDHRLEPHGHYVVSGPVGSVPLHEYLRQHRAVPFGDLCDFVTLLAESLEAAVEARWPRCSIDSHTLMLGECSLEAVRRGVCLSVPPLPGPELRPAGARPLPEASTAYVPDLAFLVCDLLGSPARIQRFKPIAQVGALTNQLLRFVLEGQWQGHIESARAFALSLRNTAASDVARSVPFAAQPLMTFVDTPSAPPPIPPQSRTPVNASSPTSAVTAQVPPPVASATALKSLARQPQAAPIMELVRLQPKSEAHQTSVTLCLAGELTIGRGAACAHVAQFFPRNPRNDQRTRMISRQQLSLRWTNGAPLLTEPADVNQSFAGGQPLGGRLKLGNFARVSIAGEYDLDIRSLPSWWPVGQLWKDAAPAAPGSPSGSLLLVPMQGLSALDTSTIWLFTDAAFGIGPSGAIDLQPASMRDVIGSFVRDGSALFVVTAESDGVVRLNGESLQAQQPRSLKPGDELRIGAVEMKLATQPASP